MGSYAPRPAPAELVRRATSQQGRIVEKRRDVTPAMYASILKTPATVATIVTMPRALLVRCKRESVRVNVSRLYGALLAIGAMKADLAQLHPRGPAPDLHRIGRKLDTVERSALTLLDALEARRTRAHH